MTDQRRIGTDVDNDAETEQRLRNAEAAIDMLRDTTSVWVC